MTTRSDSARRLGAELRERWSRSAALCVRACRGLCMLTPCLLISFACGPWRRRSLQAGWICWSTDRGYLQNSWKPPCGPPQVAAQQHCAFVSQTHVPERSPREFAVHTQVLYNLYIHMYYTIRLIYQSSRRTPSRMRRLHASSRAVATACCGCMPPDATKSQMPLSRPRANCVRSFGT